VNRRAFLKIGAAAAISPYLPAAPAPAPAPAPAATQPVIGAYADYTATSIIYLDPPAIPCTVWAELRAMQTAMNVLTSARLDILKMGE